MIKYVFGPTLYTGIYSSIDLYSFVGKSLASIYLQPENLFKKWLTEFAVVSKTLIINRPTVSLVMYKYSIMTDRQGRNKQCGRSEAVHKAQQWRRPHKVSENFVIKAYC